MHVFYVDITHNPKTIFENMVKIHNGKWQNNVVLVDTEFAQGVIKFASINDELIAVISEMQYIKPVQIHFRMTDELLDHDIINLMYYHQSCLFIHGTPFLHKLNINTQDSQMNFDGQNAIWTPSCKMTHPQRTISIWLTEKWFNSLKLSNSHLKKDGSNNNVLPAVSYMPIIENGSLINIEQIFNALNEDTSNPLINLKIESNLSALVAGTLYSFDKRPSEEHFELIKLLEFEKIQIQKAKEEMVRDFSNTSLNGDYLAKLAGMNRTKFQQTFKNIYKVPFYKFYQEARFNEALRLLEFEQYTTTSVAAAVGYKNVGYFIKEFQKRFGLTPNEYKLKNTK